MTYRQLGERLRRGEGEEGRLESRLREEGRRGQAALRCIVGERSRIENAGIAPRNIDFDTCTVSIGAEVVPFRASQPCSAALSEVIRPIEAVAM